MKQVQQSEEAIIAEAREAMSVSNWTVGECVAKWTKKYARGRTDADFGSLIGLSGDQVYSRRRVWERFGKFRNNTELPWLAWSHYFAAVSWEDWETCLKWAAENEATVAEMRAWRRAQHGEDLFSGPEENYSPWAGPLVMDGPTPAANLEPLEADSPGAKQDPGEDEPDVVCPKCGYYDLAPIDSRPGEHWLACNGCEYQWNEAARRNLVAAPKKPAKKKKVAPNASKNGAQPSAPMSEVRTFMAAKLPLFTESKDCKKLAKNLRAWANQLDPPSKFVPPEIEDVADYCLQRQNGIDPEAWMAHYQSNGWRVGRGSGKPMKDWRAAVITWEKANGTQFKGTGYAGSDEL